MTMGEAARTSDIFSLHARGAVATAGGSRAWVLKKREAYGALALPDAFEVARAALATADAELREEVLTHLACLVPGSLREVQPELARAGILYPPCLFWQAGPEARDLLLVALRRGLEGPTLSHCISCLAWVGDDEVQATFAAWRTNPPAWASELFVAPHLYAAEAGWELMPDGARRELCSLVAYRLEPTADEVADSHVVAAASTQRCPHHDHTLTELFDLPTDHEGVRWLGVAGGRFRVLTCTQETAYGCVYANLDTAGTPTWSTANTRAEFHGDDTEVWEAYPPTSVKLTLATCGPLEAHAYVTEGGASRLGGYPSWVQDAVYPPCPTCQRSMCFVGQVRGRDLDEFGVGTFYAFACAACRTTATTYQQT